MENAGRLSLPELLPDEARLLPLVTPDLRALPTNLSPSDINPDPFAYPLTPLLILYMHDYTSKYNVRQTLRNVHVVLENNPFCASEAGTP